MEFSSWSSKIRKGFFWLEPGISLTLRNSVQSIFKSDVSLNLHADDLVTRKLFSGFVRLLILIKSGRDSFLTSKVDQKYVPQKYSNVFMPVFEYMQWFAARYNLRFCVVYYLIFCWYMAIIQCLTGTKLDLFGSSKNGFGFKQSDLDICMTIDGLETAEVGC